MHGWLVTDLVACGRDGEEALTGMMFTWIEFTAKVKQTEMAVTKKLAAQPYSPVE
jgi:hypothetical protein